MVNKKMFKGLDETKVLYMVFILLAILVIGSLFIANPKFTGLVVFSEYDNQGDCENATYVWGDVIEEVCTPIEGCEIGVTGCVDICDECEDVVTWKCDDLEYDNQIDCAFNNQTWIETTENVCTPIEGCEIGVTGCAETCETCEDVITGQQCVGDVCDTDNLNLCLTEGDCIATEVGGFWYDNICNAEVECVPSTCGDSCGDVSDGCGGTLDCGICEDDDDDDDDDTSSTTGAVVDTVDHTKSSCVSAWSCAAWTECVGGTQTRECTDVYNCRSPTSDPEITQSCEVEKEEVIVSETCSDGIKNQDEKGIDCGGVCEEGCGFFTIVGNAVNVPINSSTQFVKENKALSFSVLGVIVLVVSWILVAKFVLKKNTFFFLKNVDWSKYKRCFDFLKRKK